MSKASDEIVAEARRIEEDSTLSAKGHFNVADRWRKYNYFIGIPASLSAAASGLAALSSNEAWAVLLAFISAALAALMTFLNPAEHAASHQSIGNRYNTLKNRSRVLANVDSKSLNTAELRARLAGLESDRDEINDSSPGIPRYAFNKARDGVEEGESTYDVDDRAGL